MQCTGVGVARNLGSIRPFKSVVFHCFYYNSPRYEVREMLDRRGPAQFLDFNQVFLLFLQDQLP